ncbi:uncharacterized protein LTR77_000875 [Saxophila tyrrhenica]|uniref:Vegetatible incompatibility protein HET-E-1 n=1 Tax=Saxophila tyrrhenica TaxID=1690608 RepID=A0AAV9PP00_9PEZI|nr:hypothetical protein LTR77_000875 [Saxophila tyrrhenica]
MNEYELRRQEKIRKNQALLAGLDIKPIEAPRKRRADGQPAAKKRKLLEPTAPSRTSARIASAPEKPSYNDNVDTKPIPLPRSAPKKKSKSRVNDVQDLGSRVEEEPEPLVPKKNVEEIQAGWTAWEPVANPPIRDDDRTFRFDDHPDFTPNKSPEEMLKQGCFGGSYYRPLRSRKLGIIVEDDWKELPKEWTEGLDIDRYLTSPEYDPDVNKFKVSCGQSIEEWEAAGWISHEHDVRGWFQWYTRFFRGRRCDDDERQISRWKKCVGQTGRWRRMLLKKYMKLGVRDVFDDGADEDAPEVSPVMHQTCHHWAYEVRQEDLDHYWATGGR